MEGEGGEWSAPKYAPWICLCYRLAKKTAHLQIFTSISPQVVWQHKLDEAEA